MKKLILFPLLLFLQNTTECMELALTQQSEPEQKASAENQRLIFEITATAPIPFLNMMSRVNLAKTCKSWYAAIKPQEMWYNNIHPGYLDIEDCKNLNHTSYTHAMIYYARQNNATMFNFIHDNANEHNKSISRQICKALKKDMINSYANQSYDAFINKKTNYGAFCVEVSWPLSICRNMKIIIHLFLLQGMDVNHTFEIDQSTLLHFIADEKIQYLPAKQIINHPELNANKQNKYGKSPLHYTAITTSWCRNDDIETEGIKQRLSIAVELLKREDTNLNIQDIEGKTPLICAIPYFCNDALELLLKNEKTNPNLTDKNGYSALHYSIKTPTHNGREAKSLKKATESLLANKKTNSNFKDNNGDTVLHSAAEKSGTIINKQIKMLTNHPESQINPTNNNGYTPLDYAIGHQSDAKELLQKKGAIRGSFFEKHRKAILTGSFIGILGLISATIFAYFHYNTHSLTQ